MLLNKIFLASLRDQEIGYRSYEGKGFSEDKIKMRLGDCRNLFSRHVCCSFGALHGRPLETE